MITTGFFKIFISRVCYYIMGACIKTFNLYGISTLMVFIGRPENTKLRVFILKNVYIEMISIKEIIIVVHV